MRHLGIRFFRRNWPSEYASHEYVEALKRDLGAAWHRELELKERVAVLARELELERERYTIVGHDGPWTKLELNRLGKIHGELAEIRGDFSCVDPEGDWIRDQEQEAGWSRGEHEAEGRAVEAHQEAKHGDW